MTHRIALWILSMAAALASLLAGYLYVDRENCKNEAALKNEEAKQRQSESKKYGALKESLGALLKKYRAVSDVGLDDERLLEHVAFALKESRNASDSLKKSLSEQAAATKLFSAQATRMEEALRAKNVENAFILRRLHESQSEADSLYQALERTLQTLSEMRVDSVTFVSPKGVEVAYYGRLLGRKPFGFGIGFYKGKGYYIGEWNGNARHGKGKHVYLNGDVYEGDFINDLREGYGIYRYASGELYEGEWKADLMNGAGKITFKDGDVKSGIWLEGKIQENN